MPSFLSMAATPMRWFNNHFSELTRSILFPGPIDSSPGPVPASLDIPPSPNRGMISPDSPRPSNPSPRSGRAPDYDSGPERDHPRQSSARDQQSLKDLVQPRQEDWLQEQREEEARRANTQRSKKSAPKPRIKPPASTVSPPQPSPQAPAPSTLSLPPWLRRPSSKADAP
jgi:hypothetical protein